MKNFYIYTHPVYGEKIESDGFTFLGFFFTILWLFFKKLYRQSVYVLIVFIALSIATTFIEARAEQALIKYEEAKAITSEKINNAPLFRTSYWDYRDNGISDKKARALARKEYIQRLEQPELLSIFHFFVLALGIILQFYIGKNGRLWVLNDLKRRGFKLQNSIYAENKDAMLAELHQEQSEKND